MLLIGSLFFWAIWNAFLQDAVSWKKTWFKNYVSFYENVESGYFAKELPQSACEIKYYWGNRNFVRVGGYGISLSDEEYILAKLEALQRYQQQFNKHDAISTEELFLGGDEADRKWLTEEHVAQYDIKEIKALILNEEEQSDYYVVASYVYNGGPINYYSCVFCNDKSRRIIEMTVTNRNPR